MYSSQVAITGNSLHLKLIFRRPTEDGQLDEYLNLSDCAQSSNYLSLADVLKKKANRRKRA